MLDEKDLTANAYLTDFSGAELSMMLVCDGIVCRVYDNRQETEDEVRATRGLLKMCKSGFHPTLV